jgi:hypothetical protein
MKQNERDAEDANAPPWAYFGEDESGLDKLQGNRAGLVIIRDAINAALESGRFEICIDEIVVSGVEFIPGPHRRPSAFTPTQDKVMTWGCVTLFLAFGFLVILTLFKLFLLIP